LDQVKYEDELRETFGISSSYILFTLDKLILQLVKQVQLILTDETCTKLLSLYTYEASRATGFITQTYLANVMEVLGEERFFKFEFEQAPRFNEFTIQLLDSNQPRYMELSINKDKWNNYVENYVHGDSNQIDVRKHHIFLLRNKKKNLVKKDKEKMEDLDIHNGLECKICLNTYKLFYVEDTEDYFHRKKNYAY